MNLYIFSSLFYLLDPDPDPHLSMWIQIWIQEANLYANLCGSGYGSETLHEAVGGPPHDTREDHGCQHPISV